MIYNVFTIFVKGENMKKFRKTLSLIICFCIILFCFAGCHGKDVNAGSTSTSLNADTENSQAQASVKAELVGSWKHEEDMTSENEVYGHLVITVMLNGDGTYKKTSALTVNRDKFINAFIDEANSNTKEEIDAYLKMYGYSSVREYAEDYYSNEVETLIKELTYEKSGEWSADSSKIYMDSSSSDYSFNGTELIIEKNTYIKQ